MSVLAIVAPIFVLVALGYVAARARWLSEPAQKGILEFGFNFAMPALLFRGIAGSRPGETGAVRMAVVYFTAMAIVWGLATILTGRLLRRPRIDAATIAMTSSFGNVVMIGLPLVLAVVGDAAASPIAVLLALHSPVLWIAGTLQHQGATQSGGRSVAGIALDLARQLVLNPLLIAIVAGLAWRLLGQGMPQALDSTFALLGQAGVPCAQVALGASLTRFVIKGQLPTLAVMLTLKLIAFPVVVYLLSAWVFHLPKASLEVALILAAMPAGANAYMFADRTQRVMNSSSGAIALGTVLAAMTVTLLISNLDGWLPN